MIEGDKKVFAIEYSLDADFGGKWLFGKLAFWINGDMIGNYDAGTSLADCLGFVTGILKYDGRRGASSLCDQSPDFVFDLFEKAIFEDENDDFIRHVSDFFLIQVPGPFLLTPLVDIFDHCRAYIFECGEFDKIIYKKSLDQQAKSIELPKGYLSATVKPFYDWLNRLYDVHVKK